MERSSKIVIKLLLLFVFVIKLYHPAHTFAASTTIQINEICYNSSDKGEWIELYNSSSLPVNISGWKLIYQSSSSATLRTNTVPTTSKDIPAGGFALLAKNSLIISAWGLDPVNPPADLEIIYLSSWFTYGLSNDGGHLALFDATASIIPVDTISWGDDASIFTLPDLIVNHSYDRKTLGVDTDAANDFVDRSTPTPGKKYEKLIYPDNIIITELVPEPVDGTENEFIELYNSGQTTVDLTGWQIDDVVGGSSPYTIKSLAINPGQYFAFYNNETGISLNDDGDSVRLIDPNGDVKTEISYSKAIRGQSYSLSGTTWSWSLSLTPNQTNILTKNETTPATSSIGEVRKLADNALVTITGIVTAPPGKLSNRYFYIQDDSDGIQVYSYDKDFPDLQNGDVITVTGELSGQDSDRRIKVENLSDIIIINHAALPAPKKVSIDDIGESVEGQYVKTRGTVTETSGDTFTIHGSGEVKTIIRGSTGINKPTMKKGDVVEVAGIVSQYKDEFRILPFRQEDVTIIQSPHTKQNKLPKAGTGIWQCFIITLILFLIVYVIPNLFRNPSNLNLNIRS